MPIFPTSMVEPIPAAFRKRYLMYPVDRTRDIVRIVPELRRNTRFLQLNLMDASYPFDRDIDVIFCRNILIYFNRATQRAVLSRLIAHIRPGGYLVLGHSEASSLEDRAGMCQMGPSIFQKGRVMIAKAA